MGSKMMKQVPKKNLINLTTPLNKHLTTSYQLVYNFSGLSFSLSVKAGKMKSRKAVSKRFRTTGRGRIIRSQSGKKHLNEKKTRTRKNNLSAYKILAGKEAKNVS